MLRWNILQYLTKMLRQYFICNERLEIFLTCFCNILCYVGGLAVEVLNSISKSVARKKCYRMWNNSAVLKSSIRQVTPAPSSLPAPLACCVFVLFCFFLFVDQIRAGREKLSDGQRTRISQWLLFKKEKRIERSKNKQEVETWVMHAYLP